MWRSHPSISRILRPTSLLRTSTHRIQFVSAASIPFNHAPTVRFDRCSCGNSEATVARRTYYHHTGAPTSISGPPSDINSVSDLLTASNDFLTSELSAQSKQWPPAVDTIYQLSSGLGGGRTQPAVGVAIIRVSGPLALPILMALTRRQQVPKPRQATRVTLYQPLQLDHNAIQAFEKYYEPPLDSTKKEPSHATPTDLASIIDSGILALYFPGPNSFTGESVVEFHIHGTPLIVNHVFQALEQINRQLSQRIVNGTVGTISHDGTPTLSESATPNQSFNEPDSEDPNSLARLSSILACPPLIRLAQPGEFTRRAFMNGKLDLTQVEALGDLLHAETDRQKSQALIQMRGELGVLYSQWRLDLLNSLAYIEAVLDFSEDEQDVGESEIVANVLPKVRDIAHSLQQHLSDHRRGELVRNGVAIVIIGSPNAGKSTLLNALAQRNVAIVSPVPGTTRDIVENRLNIAGWACILADTAGLREIRKHDATSIASSNEISDLSTPADLLSGHDLIEAEGMKRTHERTQEADIKLVLLDASQLLASNTIRIDAQVFNLIDDASIVVWTKMDLIPLVAMSSASSSSPTAAAPSASTTGRAKLRTAQQFYTDHRDTFTPDQLQAFQQLAAKSKNYELVAAKTKHITFLACPAISINSSGTTNNKGIQQLLSTIERQIHQTVGLDATIAAPSSTTSPSSSSSSMPLITRHRHRVHVSACLAFLQLFEQYMARSDLVLAAEQLRLATREIGKITGRVDVEELLDVIFEDFCIGK